MADQPCISKRSVHDRSAATAEPPSAVTNSPTNRIVLAMGYSDLLRPPHSIGPAPRERAGQASRVAADADRHAHALGRWPSEAQRQQPAVRTARGSANASIFRGLVFCWSNQ